MALALGLCILFLAIFIYVALKQSNKIGNLKNDVLELTDMVEDNEEDLKISARSKSSASELLDRMRNSGH